MTGRLLVGLTAGAIWLSLLAACNEAKPDPKAEAPPTASVQPDLDANNFKVDHPEQFPLTTASERSAVPALRVNGVVQPDISRNVPVISLVAGRVIEVRARLGDTVKKGDVLMRVQSSDISGALADYRKAVNDERLARAQLDRAKLLYSKGAIAQKDLEVSRAGEEDAQATLEAAREHLRVLRVDQDDMSEIAEVRAPISGVITDQQVTTAGGVQGLGSPNPFTISDLSRVWIICDVYENDLDAVHVGEYADIRLTSNPGPVFKGRVNNVLPILDPNLRTAKVRVEVRNPGQMRVGMFVTATFYGRRPVTRAVIPASAILHLHDRHWVYAALGRGHFKRQEIVAGDTVGGNLQEVVSGLKPGDQVVTNALELQNTVEQ